MWPKKSGQSNGLANKRKVRVCLVFIGKSGKESTKMVRACGKKEMLGTRVYRANVEGNRGRGR